MFNRKTSVNGTKGIKRTGKAIAFIALFIMLTLVFTMYQTSVNEVGSTVLDALDVDTDELLPVMDGMVAEASGSQDARLISKSFDSTINGATEYALDLSASTGSLGRTWATDTDHTTTSASYTSSVWKFGNTDTHSTSGCASVVGNFDLGARMGYLCQKGFATLTFEGKGSKGDNLDNYAFTIGSSTSAFSNSVSAKSDALHVEARDGTTANKLFYGQKTGDATYSKTGGKIAGRYIRVILSAYDAGGLFYKWGPCQVSITTCKLVISDKTNPSINGQTTSGKSSWGTSSSLTIKDANSGLYSLSYTYDDGSSTSLTVTKGSTSDYTFSCSNGYGKYTITAEDYCGRKNTYTYYYYNPTVQVIATTGGKVYLGSNSSTSSLSQKYTKGSSYTISAVPNDGYYFAGWIGSNLKSGTNYTASNTPNSGLSFSLTFTITDPGNGNYKKEITWTAQFKEITATDGTSWTTAEFKSGSTKAPTYNYTEYTIGCAQPSAAISGDGEYKIDITYGGTTTAGRTIEKGEKPRYTGSYTAQIEIKCGDKVVGQTAVQNLTINQQSLTYSPVFDNNGNKTYDGTATANFTRWDVTSGTEHTGDGFSASPSNPEYIYSDSDGNPKKDVGTYKLRVNGAFVKSGSDDVKASYTITNGDHTEASTEGTISRKTLTLTGVAVDKEKNYDGKLSHTISSYGNIQGCVSGQTVSIDVTSASATFGNKTVEENKTVTISGIKLTPGENTKLTNYTVSAGTWTVESIKYNISAKELDDGGLIGDITCTATIKAIAATVEITATDKVYDGTTAINTVTLIGQNIVDGDDVTFDYGTATFASADYGTRTVTVDGIKISGGADKDNYTLSNTVATSNANITRRPIVVRAKAVGKIYGEADPALTYEWSEAPKTNKDNSDFEEFVESLTREGGDNATKDDNYTAFVDYKIYFGNYQLINGVITDGATAEYGNYSITMYSATFTINKLEVIVDVADISAVYGDDINLGKTNAQNLTFKPYSGFTPRDGYTFASPSSGYPVLTIGDKPCVGTHTPYVAEGQNLETLHQNFRYTLASTPTKVTVTPQTVTVTYYGETVTYGNEPEFTLHYAGFVYDEDETTVFEEFPNVNPSLNSYGNINAGIYSYVPEGGTIKLNAQGNANYNVNLKATGKLNVEKRTLNSYFYGFGKTAGETYERVYDGTKPELNVYYVGFAGVEGIEVLTKESKAYLNADNWPNVGQYYISVEPGDADNYKVEGETNRYVEIKKAALTVTYVSETVVYGTTPKGELAYSGFVTYQKDGETYTETPSDAFANKNVYPRVEFPSGRINVGEYSYAPSKGTSKNYELTYVEGTLEVTPKAMTAEYKGNTVTYGVNPNIAFNFVGLVDGDTSSDALYDVVKSDIPRDAGTYTLGADNFAFTAVNGNYTVTVLPGTLTINKAQLSVKAQTSIKVYGEVKADYEVALTYDGFVGVDNVSVLDSVPVAPVPAVNAWGYVDCGQYTICPANGEAKNYNFSYSAGSLTVNKKTLTVTYPGETVIYNGTALQPQKAIEYAGFADGETENNLTSDYLTHASVPLNTGVNAGSYTLTPYGCSAKNYSIQNVSGDFTVIPVTITVKYSGESVVYGTAPALTITYTGWLESLPEENTLTMVQTRSALYYGETTTMPVGVGSYDLTLSDATCVNGNYVFEYVDGTLTITQKELKVAFEDETLGYGDVYMNGTELVFPWTPVYDGFEYDDDESVLVNKPVVTAPESFGQGTYTITPVCADGYTAESSELNYKYVFEAGILVIEKKLLTVRYASDVKDYGTVGEGYDFMSRISYEGVAYGMGDTNASVLDTSEVALNGMPTQNARGYFDAGVYNITPYGLKILSDNYVVTDETYVKGALTVNKINLEVYVEDYDTSVDALPTSATVFKLVYSGFATGEDVSVLKVLPTVDITALPQTVGFHTVTPVMSDGSDPMNADGNYNIILVAHADNYNIYKASFDMSNVQFADATYEYDGEKHSIYVISGIPTVDGEEQAITAHYNNNEQRNVGTYEVTVYFTHNVVGYSRIKDTFTAYITITQHAIEYEVDSSLLSEIYGNGDKTLTGTPSWKAEDDDLNEKITLPEYEGSYRPVGDYQISASFDNKNYVVTFKTSDGELLENVKYSVLKRSVTVELGNQTAEYKGDENPVVDQTAYTVTSDLKIMDDDDIGINIGIESADKYIVRDGGYALTGSYNTLNLNYEVTFVSATFTLTRAQLNLTLAPQSYIYDGTEAVIDQTAYAFGAGEVKSGDELTPVIVYKDEGEHVHVVYAKDGSIGGYALTAVLENGNYEISVVDSVMTVGKRSATLTVREQTYVYGSVSALDQTAYDLDGVVKGDNLNVRLTRQGGGIVGEYVIYATTNNGDYNVTVINGVFRITKRPVNLDVSRIDGATYVYVAGGVYIKADSVRYATHDNDDISDYNIGINYPEEPFNAGTHVITISVGETQNHFGASVDVTVYVEKATTVIDTTLIESTEYSYNGAEQTINGAVFNNTDPDAELTYADNVFVNVPENGYLNVTISAPETANYKAATKTLSVTIKRAVMNFANYEFRTDYVSYDGTDHVISATGVPDGVTVTYIYDGQESGTPFAFRNAGTYTVSLRFEYDSVNYASPSVGTEATLSVYRASITVKANDLTGQYGDEVVFTDDDYTIIEGTVYGDDDIGVTISTERVIRDIGVYTLSATASNPNYNIVVDAGSYTITKRQLTVKFDDISALYGDSEHKFTYTVMSGSVLEGDTLAVSAQREPGKTVGEYPIFGTVENPLYEIVVLDGVYSISKRPITIVVEPQTGTSARDLKDDRFTVEGGVVAGDSLDIEVVGEIGSEPGAYALSATYTDNDNYEIIVVGATFDLVRLAKITVGSELYRKVYDGIPVIPEVSINSGAELKFTVRGSSVHNSFTEIGSYEVVVSADAVEGYSAPASVTFYVEICPVRLTAEIDGLIFAIDNSDGFNPDDRLVIERNEESSLSNSEFMQQLNGAYKFVIESDGINYTVGEYFNGSEVALKVKPTEELAGAKKFSSYVVDADGQKVADASLEADEDGFISVSAVSGESVYFVSERENVVPILIIVCGLVFATTLLMLYMIFRRKA